MLFSYSQKFIQGYSDQDNGGVIFNYRVNIYNEIQNIKQNIVGLNFLYPNFYIPRVKYFLGIIYISSIF